MVSLVKLFGIIFVGFGVAFFVRKDLLRKWGEFWIKNSQYLYLGGIINLLIGLMFLFVAADCQVSWFVVIMGLLSIIKGISLIALGPKKFTPIIKRCLKTVGPKRKFLRVGILRRRFLKKALLNLFI